MSSSWKTAQGINWVCRSHQYLWHLEISCGNSKELAGSYSIIKGKLVTFLFFLTVHDSKFWHMAGWSSPNTNDVPRGFRIKCASWCMQIQGCKAFTIAHDANGVPICVKFHTTENPVRPQFIRAFTTPSEGILLFLFKVNKWFFFLLKCYSR